MLTVAGLTLLAAACAASINLHQTQDRIVRLDESGFRRAAVATPLPEYPSGSIQRKVTGVAVAAVTFGDNGRTRDVQVLQAPDDEIARAVDAALRQWTWTPIRVADRSENYGAEGKIVFYFRIEGGKPRVIEPELPSPPKRSSSGGDRPPPAVHGGGHGSNAPEVTEADLKARGTTQASIVIDIGDREAFKRGHRQGAINIPQDELILRGRVELDPKKTYVIDCTQEERLRCGIAHDVLKDIGIVHVALLVR